MYIIPIYDGGCAGGGEPQKPVCCIAGVWKRITATLAPWAIGAGIWIHVQVAADLEESPGTGSAWNGVGGRRCRPVSCLFSFSWTSSVYPAHFSSSQDVTRWIPPATLWYDVVVCFRAPSEGCFRMGPATHLNLRRVTTVPIDTWNQSRRTWSLEIHNNRRRVWNASLLIVASMSWS